jgi:hypothetical protein
VLRTLPPPSLWGPVGVTSASGLLGRSRCEIDAVVSLDRVVPLGRSRCEIELGRRE